MMIITGMSYTAVTDMWILTEIICKELGLNYRLHGRVLIRLAALPMVADPSELCGTAGDLLIYELAEFRLLSSTRSDKKLSILSDVQLGR